MKKLVALALSACALAPAFAQTSVGVSIGINQPGVYGRIDIGTSLDKAGDRLTIRMRVV